MVALPSERIGAVFSAYILLDILSLSRLYKASTITSWSEPQVLRAPPSAIIRDISQYHYLQIARIHIMSTTKVEKKKDIFKVRVVGTARKSDIGRTSAPTFDGSSVSLSQRELEVELTRQRFIT